MLFLRGYGSDIRDGKLTLMNSSIETMNKKLIIRADAGGKVASGHVMRCLALAQRWKACGGDVLFVTACNNQGMQRRLCGEGFETRSIDAMHPEGEDWDITSTVLQDTPSSWVVLDGYHFDSEYQLRIMKLGHKLLVIDDIAHLPHYHADIVLNQNVCADEHRYSSAPCSKLFLGTKYALLRSEFMPWRGRQKNIRGDAERVLIMFGGSDPDNVTLKAVDALGEIGDRNLDVVVVVGPSYAHMDSLKEALGSTLHRVALVHDPRNLAELMEWADVAITASGSTCWELAFMGVPSLLLALADNQRMVAERLDSDGIAVSLGWHGSVRLSQISSVLKDLLDDVGRRIAMSNKAQMCVDGVGADRVVAAMEGFPGCIEHVLDVRPARLEDAALLWRWVSDEGVRRNSLHSRKIPWEEHVGWLENKLASDNTRIWIVELDEMPVAQIRYDRIDGNSAQIDISVASEHRGRGVGSKAIELTLDAARSELGVDRIKGVVVHSNKASVRTFVKSGFTLVGQECLEGRVCEIFIKRY